MQATRFFPMFVLVVWGLVFAANVTGEELTGRFEKSITKSVSAKYLVVTPRDYDQSQSSPRKYPVLIFLHGRGEQGDDLALVKVHGPFKKVAELNLPLVIVAPQSPKDEWWDVDVLEALVEEIIKTLNVDQDRIYLTGLSMGGSGTWELASHRPDLFAAIAPVCGWGVPSKAGRLKNLPVWAFHGDRDDVVKVCESANMVNALYAVGNGARLTIYPDAGHDSWTETYNNPKLYEWLLSHRRRDPSD